MITFADILLRVAQGLPKLLAAASNIKRARNLGSAELFESVSRCLSSIADELERGSEPVQQCHELLRYSQVVPRNVRRIVGFWNKGHLGNLGSTLASAVEAPSTAALNLQRKSSLIVPVFSGSVVSAVDPDGEIRKLREASGKFLAASNLIRSGVGVGDAL